MADKPHGVLVPTERIGANKYNIIPGNVTQYRLTIGQFDADTALVTVQFLIRGCKVKKSKFTHTPSDDEAYLAFKDVTREELDITAVQPFEIRQPTPGDDQPVEIDVRLLLAKGKVGGAGAPLPFAKKPRK